MLLGCCHCGQEPSESVPPSESIPPSASASTSVSASNPISTTLALCEPCIAVPKKFSVTLSGWSGLFAAHNACCSEINGTYTIAIDDIANYSGGGVNYFGSCQFWKSADKCTNQNSATTVAPTCDPHATRPLIEMVSILKTISSTTMRYALTVWTITPGGFGSTFWPWVFEGADIGGDLAKCLYPTVSYVTNTNPNARCTPGTVTLVPL
jgi:hypothetical protein